MYWNILSNMKIDIKYWKAVINGACLVQEDNGGQSIDVLSTVINLLSSSFKNTNFFIFYIPLATVYEFFSILMTVITDVNI